MERAAPKRCQEMLVESCLLSAEKGGVKSCPDLLLVPYNPGNLMATCGGDWYHRSSLLLLACWRQHSSIPHTPPRPPSFFLLLVFALTPPFYREMVVCNNWLLNPSKGTAQSNWVVFNLTLLMLGEDMSSNSCFALHLHFEGDGTPLVSFGFRKPSLKG